MSRHRCHRSLILTVFLTSGWLGCSGRPDVGGDRVGAAGAGATATETTSGGTTSTGSSTTPSLSGGSSSVIINTGLGGTAGATSSAPAPYCGDGKINQSFEQCDDGNSASGDGCGPHCELEAGWVCPTPGMACVNTVVCGDGKVGVGESCDDHNTESGDGCDSKCQVEDGYTCPVPGELCRAVCGDGQVRGKEQCDDGNTNDADGCSSTCQLEAGWVCPDGGQPCKQTVCGDGNREGSEECDDGNLRPYDGCSPTCTVEPTCGTDQSPVGKCASRCGDGILLTSAAEECDDGNTVSGDGCSADCKTELGYTCTTPTTEPPPSIAVPIVFRDFRAFSSWAGPGSTNPIGHPDMERISPQQSQTGIVNAILGSDRKPVYTGTDAQPPTGGGATTPQTTGKSYFDQWYRDVTDVDGNGNAVNARIDDTMTLTRNSSGSYSMDSRAVAPWKDIGGFFPLDGRGFGNDGEGSDSSGRNHNFHFTSELRYWFEYKGGEQLEFSGDDDVWVFVNGHLAVDLGGVHCRQYGALILNAQNGHGNICRASSSCSTLPSCTPNVDTDFGLATGNIYEIAVFQAERHTTESNYWLTLSNILAGKSKCAPRCGDGIVTPDEQCDRGADKNTGECGGCNADCTLAPYCGDGNLDAACSEQCDDGVNKSLYGGCAPGCVKGPYCGDGIVQAAFEQCDDGTNTGGYDKCGPGCVYGPRCGDGIVQSPQEQCDEGPNNGSGTCDRSCRVVNIY